jgi:DNA-binding CsgD family transcriptional regulator
MGNLLLNLQLFFKWKLNEGKKLAFLFTEYLHPYLPISCIPNCRNLALLFTVYSIASKVLAMFKSGTSFTKDESHNLTDREMEVLKYLVDGMSYKAVADKCFVSLDTVSSHVKNIYKKLQVNSKSEAVAKAIKGKIV